MAAAGGDTVVPTNWGGLIVITVIVAVVAAATYFGMDFQFGHQGDADKSQEKSLSVQDVFSASARREVAAAGSARVLSRADLASDASTSADGASDTDSSEAGASGMADDADQTAANAGTTEAADDDWGAAASDDWDTAQDDWDSASDTATASRTDDWDAAVESSMQAAADKTSEQVQKAADATKQAGQNAMQAAGAAVDKVKAAASQAKQAAIDVVAAPDDAPNSSSSTSSARQRPDAAALRNWWSDADGDLAIRFAGTLDRGDKVSDGIAVMFSDAVSPAQGNQHMQLKDASGNEVAGSWKSSRNPNMLIMDSLDAGRYLLSIDSAIRSQNGKSLNDSASGSVFVY